MDYLRLERCGSFAVSNDVSFGSLLKAAFEAEEDGMGAGKPAGLPFLIQPLILHSR
jgi:hypothetical protein